MDVEGLRRCVESDDLVWRRHAVERMVDQHILEGAVRRVLLEGEVIEEYEADRPFPSALFLGFIDERPIHVVASYHAAGECGYVITAYQPDERHFESDFKTRRKS